MKHASRPGTEPPTSGRMSQEYEAVQKAWMRGELPRRSLLSRLLNYGLAVVIVAGATGVRQLFESWVGHGLPPYITFYPAIMAIVLVTGLGPSILATAMMVLIAAYWILPPVGQFAIASPVDRLALAIFTGTTLIVSMFSDRYRRYRDQSAAIEREAVLNESRERLATFVAATFEGIVESEAGRIVDCNEQFARMSGYARSELRGMQVTDLLDPEESDRVMANIRAGGESLIEHALLRKDGRRIMVEAHGRPVAPGSARRHTALRDITERKQTENALRQTTAGLQAANAELNDSRRAAINLLEDALAARRQAEEATDRLRESEEQFRVLTQNLESAVALIDEHGAFSIVNSSFLSMFDIPQDADILNVNSRDWSQWQVFDEHGELLEVDEHPVRKAALTRTKVQNQLVAVKSPATPNPKWLLVSAEPLLDAQGDVHRLICTYHDITERKLAEDVLARAHEQTEADRRQLAAVLQTSPVGVVLVEAVTGRLSLVNERAAEIYGIDYGGSDLETHLASVKVLLSDGTPFPVEDLPVSRAFGGEVVHNVEMTIERGNGVRVPLSVNAAPLRDAEGNVTKAVVAFDDITERKRAEEGLTRQARELAELVRLLDLATVLVRDPQDRITRWNTGSQRLYGFTAEQALGRISHELLATRFSEPPETIRAVLQETGRWEGVLVHTAADGRQVTVASEWTLFRGAEGQTVAILESNTDITARKQAEEALQKTRDALAIQVEERVRELREKEVLLKEVHHRVKNNLQVISSLVGLQADGLQDETVREVLQDVIFRVRSMALVHEKLYQSETLARIDFAEYAQSLLSYLWRAHGAAAEAIRLTFDLEPVSLPVDTAVPCGLILNELAGNAIKHAFRGRSEGEVTVSLRRTGDGRVSLSVRDDGVGLPAEFDWRKANSLGLRLVQMLAGQLQAEVESSGSGGGTNFEITFGFKEKDVAPPDLPSD